jgi:hypothetical protein
MVARDTVNRSIPEWRLQAEAVAGLQELQARAPGAFEFAASLEGVVGALSRAMGQLLRACGMQAGEPDLRIYLANGRLLFIEMKGERGRLIDSQRQRFPKLEALGFTIHTVKAATPAHARDQVVTIVRAAAGI